MPRWIHNRAMRILAENADMPESMAWGIATQQAHAIGKSPKGYGTEQGRLEAKEKHKDPKSMKKTAFMEALPTLTGLATGYGPGRSIAGETAASIAPKGRVNRSETFARNAAVIGAPLGGLLAMGLIRKHKLAPALGELASRKFPMGLIAEPSAEQELIHLGLPGAGAILGSLAGGAATGGLVGGAQRLRGPLHHHEKTSALKPSPMWGTVGGQANAPAWRSQAGFTPTGMRTPAQRLQRSMGMAKHDPNKGLKPLDLGKLQEEATGVKMGAALATLTALNTGMPSKREREDAETGDEYEPPIAKAAEDGMVHGGFNTNQYSGVMNPPPMVYRSGIPAWREPPVKASLEGEKTAHPAYFDPEVKALNAKWDRHALIGAGTGALSGAALGHLSKAPGAAGMGAIFGGVLGMGIGGLTVENQRQQAMHDARVRWEETMSKLNSAGITPLSRLNSSKAVGAPKTSAPPGPSIAQISKPKGYGMPLSGAKKGNHTI